MPATRARLNVPPPTVVKVPPANTALPSVVSARTSPPARFGFQDSRASAPSNAASRPRALPPTEVNAPPATSVGPTSSSALTAPPTTAGAKDVRAPSPAATAASPLRAVPPTAVNVPPRKSVVPRRRSARISPPVTDGAKPSSSLPSARRCTSPVRGVPATAVIVPPRYQPPAPSAAEASTSPSTKRAADATRPASSVIAAAPVERPMRSKKPATYSDVPAGCSAETAWSVKSASRGVSGRVAAPATPGTSSVARTATSALRVRILETVIPLTRGDHPDSGARPGGGLGAPTRLEG